MACVFVGFSTCRIALVGGCARVFKPPHKRCTYKSRVIVLIGIILCTPEAGGAREAPVVHEHAPSKEGAAHEAGGAPEAAAPKETPVHEVKGEREGTHENQAGGKDEGAPAREGEHENAPAREGEAAQEHSPAREGDSVHDNTATHEGGTPNENPVVHENTAHGEQGGAGEHAAEGGGEKEGGNQQSDNKALTPAERIRENAAQGRAFEDKAFPIVTENLEHARQQVTIETTNGTRIKVDSIGIEHNPVTGENTIHIHEFKSSESAHPSKNQKEGFLNLLQEGGIVKSHIKGPVFQRGFEIPPGIEVKVIRPSDLAGFQGGA